MILSACGTMKEPAATPAPAGALEARTHEDLNAVLWMQTAVEYRASALQAYHAARVALDAALADPGETAAIEQTGDFSALPPAVVVDLDETVIDNSAFEARLIVDSRPGKPAVYTEAGWGAWIDEEKERPIPGAVEFLDYARSRGVTPIYITNGNAADGGEAATRAALKRLQVPLDAGDAALLMRGENGWNSPDKGARRAYAARRYRILLLVGDNFEDFVSVSPNARTVDGRASLAAKYSERWGTKWIVLPNPTYGSWEQAVTMGLPSGNENAALARKYATLRLDR
ncbi:MAG: 5'-nucleotidase, lipoprotein e(P4) family [Vicinamibacterales bacterium]